MTVANSLRFPGREENYIALLSMHMVENVHLSPPQLLLEPVTTSLSHLPVLEDEKLEKIQTILIRNETNETLKAILSAFYGKFLVVIGVAFPVIEALSTESFSTRFNGFYLFLNLGSISFMAYTYYQLLREEALANVLPDRYPSKMPKKHVRYGSNYLRVGVAGFGIGSMIFSGLEFGRFFEINKSSNCYTLLIAISPLARIIFVLMQMLYVFSNSKMTGGSKLYKIVARFGLMHMIATNLCEWIYVLVEETKQDILRFHRIRENNSVVAENSSDVEGCWSSFIMRSLIQQSSPYLFPCTVEYSLLCSVILGVMWSNFCKLDSQEVMSRSSSIKSRYAGNERSFMLLNDRQSGVNIIYCKSISKFSVDCANSHKGLFSGILVLVLTIISVIMFFELAHQNIEVAALQVNIWETVLFGSAITATLAAATILRKVGFRQRKRRLELEHVLLLVTQCGVFLYFTFHVFGAYYYLQLENSSDDIWRILRLVTSILALTQSSCQTILILDAWRRRCTTPSQIRDKPARQLITFLLISNLAMWIVNRLKNNSAEFHPMQLEFYGVWGWTVITHVTIPLVVCYRFQSTVCLYEIWKHVYKGGPEYHKSSMEATHLQ